jgi:hypothetical protein
VTREHIERLETAIFTKLDTIGNKLETLAIKIASSEHEGPPGRGSSAGVWTKEIAAIAKEMKPGTKTTEFWSVVAMAVLAALNKKFGLELSENVLMALAGLIGAYVLSRGWAKRKGER